jgi:predicted PurR-regulated permease PerM
MRYNSERVSERRDPLVSNRLVTRAGRWGVLAWAAIGVAVLAYLVYRYLLFPIRIVFPPLALAIVLVYLLDPIVSRLERRGMRRWLGTLATYLVFLTVLGVALAYLVPVVSHQLTQFGKMVPDLIDRAQRGVVSAANKLGLHVRAEDLFGTIKRNRGEAASFFGHITSFTFGVLHVALILVLGPVIAAYLLVDIPKLGRWVRSVIPPNRRTELEGLGSKINGALGGYFRGQLLVALFVGLASMGGLYLIGLPYWAVVGLIAGLFNLVPWIGPFIGAVPALFIAFTTPDSAHGQLIGVRPGWPMAVAAAVVLTIVQQIDNRLITPHTVARNLRLHPLTVILSLLVGGALLGLWGMLIAIPVVATLRILLVHYWDTRAMWPPRGSEPPPPAEARTPGAPPPELGTMPPDAQRRWWTRLRPGAGAPVQSHEGVLAEDRE